MPIRRHLFLVAPSPEAVALAAKDLLRTARHGIGRARQITPLRDLHLPGEAVLATAGRGLGRAAGAVIDTGARMARRVLDPSAATASSALLTPAAILDAAERHSDATSAAFADSAYAALQLALRRLGASDGLIVERGLKDAFERAAECARAVPRNRRSLAMAAHLARSIQIGRIIVDVVTPQDAQGLGGAAIARTAALSLGLAVEVASRETRSEPLPPDLVEAACDLCRSLQAEMATLDGDLSSIEAFIARYAPYL